MCAKSTDKVLRSEKRVEQRLVCSVDDRALLCPDLLLFLLCLNGKKMAEVVTSAPCSKGSARVVSRARSAVVCFAALIGARIHMERSFERPFQSAHESTHLTLASHAIGVAKSHTLPPISLERPCINFPASAWCIF